MKQYKTEAAAQAAKARREAMAKKGLEPIEDVVAKNPEVTKGVIYAWVRDGSVRAERIGKFIFADPDDVAKLVGRTMKGEPVKPKTRRKKAA